MKIMLMKVWRILRSISLLNVEFSNAFAPNYVHSQSIIILTYVNDTGSPLQFGNLVQYVHDTTLCSSGKSQSFLEPKTTEDSNKFVLLLITPVGPWWVYTFPGY